MATQQRSKVTNISSGIYFNEVDLTVAQQAAGTFAGGAIVLAEKGPAFEVITSASQEERTIRLGGLNPNYPSSYFAFSFLAQANNYKELRMLGLEGYSDTEAFAVLYDVPGVQPAVSGTQTPINIASADTTNPVLVTLGSAHGYNTGDRVVIDGVGGMTEINGAFTITVVSTTEFELTGVDGTAFGAYTTGGTVTRINSPLIATQQSVAALLKPRKTTFTGSDPILSVEVKEYTVTGEATDENFVLTITYDSLPSPTSIDVVCSLRPDSKEYLPRVFGTDPRDSTLVLGNPSPLWVEYVIDSVPSKLEATGSSSVFYYPGETNPLNSFAALTLKEGNIGVDTAFQYPAITVTGATNGNPIVMSVASPHYLIENDIVQISSVTGNTAANGVFEVRNVTSTTFELYDATTGASIDGSTSGSYISGGTVRKQYTPTWESEGLDFTNTVFQTPITPWFVSDVDLNGMTRRLFRFWSISDGEAANTEIKIEISNIDPTAKGGKGQFDVYVRLFSDRDDLTKQIVDGFPRCTMDPTDDDYVLRRIGDGENFPLRSSWIFVELNEEGGELPDNALPYGVEGYPNSVGLVYPEVVWTTQYDLNKPIRRQTLGLANNVINMFKKLAPDQLDYRDISDASAARSKGFHLNDQASAVEFALADANNFVTNPTENRANLKYVVAFYGGFDGWNVYEQRKWNDTNSKDYEALELALDKFADKENLLTDFSIITTPDLNIDEHANATEAVLEMVSGRGDALYIPDFAYDVESLASVAVNSLRFSNMRSSYSAIYHPWVQWEDAANKINKWLPPSIVAIATIASVAVNENVWQPPGGSIRTVTDNVLRTRRRMKINDREALKEVNINPITNFPGSGLEITETRTTQEAFSSLSFIHNRLLLGYVRKALNQTLRPLLHQLNNDITEASFVNAVTPVLERIKKTNGLSRFEVAVTRKSDDRVTLYGTITLYPFYPIERIVVDFVLKDEEFTFDE